MPRDDEHYIGFAISDVGRLMRTVFERRVRAFGLTRAQWLVIARVHRRPGLSQSAVADLLEIEKAPAGRLIERMEAKGWVERRDDASDRRINRLHLTSEGERLHAAIWPLAESTVDAALGELTAEERRRLTHLMSRVKATLQGLALHDPLAHAGSDEGIGEREAERL
ncbi:MAG: MarR family winged helix-turn-helix transcriptional regulator [Hyphomicrobiaceae bacterium]